MNTVDEKPQQDAEAVRTMECRACQRTIVPVKGLRNVMGHQDPYVRMGGAFSLFVEILCCPECGERDL